MPKQTNLPEEKRDREPSSAAKTALQYAGLASQLLVALGLGVFAGIRLDHWLHFAVPVGAWLLPLLILVGILVKLVRDTGTRK
jgi:hypothetical protein